jgi:hypothetical protein
VGGWLNNDTGQYILGPSEWVKDRDQAKSLGESRIQIAIWDNAKGEEIPTGGTGDRPPHG